MSSREPYRKDDVPRHTREEVGVWIKTMRDEHLTLNKLCKRLGKGHGTVATYIDKYYAGTLK